MNNATNEKTQNRTPNVADKLLELLYFQGVVSPIINNARCKLKLVKLGLTVPLRNTNSLLFAMDGQDTAYFFACTRDPKCRTPGLNFTGWVFDIAMYRKHPLEGILGVGQALRFFAFAVAQLEGIDWKEFTWTLERPFLN
jgi:hypothetical protein